MMIKLKKTESIFNKNSDDCKKRSNRIIHDGFVIILSNVTCWFPVSFLGTISIFGYGNLNNTVYSWVVLVILPINTIINPYIYSTANILDHLMKLKDQKIIEMLRNLKFSFFFVIILKIFSEKTFKKAKIERNLHSKINFSFFFIFFSNIFL